MAFGLGSWFAFSVVLVFFLALAPLTPTTAWRLSPSLAFMSLVGAFVFSWGYLSCVAYLPHTPHFGLAQLSWVGTPYVWIAGVTAFCSFSALCSFRTPTVLARTVMALFAIFLSGLTLLQTTSLF